MHPILVTHSEVRVSRGHCRGTSCQHKMMNHSTAHSFQKQHLSLVSHKVERLSHRLTGRLPVPAAHLLTWGKYQSSLLLGGVR